MFQSRCNERFATGVNTEVLVEVLGDKLCDVTYPFPLFGSWAISSGTMVSKGCFRINSQSFVACACQ